MPKSDDYIQLECLNCGCLLPVTPKLAHLLLRFVAAVECARTQPHRDQVQQQFKDRFHELGYLCIASPPQS